MISLMESKARIFRTEYKNLMYDGMCCSEPILTKGDKGLIDNFFVYSSNQEGTTFSSPRSVFGIYAEAGTAAYRMEEIPIERGLYSTDAPVDAPNETYERYVSLYPVIREIAFTECDTEGREHLRQYMHDLEMISGPVIWGFARKLFPTFFDWADRQMREID